MFLTSPPEELVFQLETTELLETQSSKLKPQKTLRTSSPLRIFPLRHLTGLAQHHTPLETNLWQGPRCSLTESTVGFSSKGFRERDEEELPCPGPRGPLCQLLLGNGSPSNWRVGQWFQNFSIRLIRVRGFILLSHLRMPTDGKASQGRDWRGKGGLLSICFLFLSLESAPWSPRFL